jgi:hypothetical protein
LPTTAGRTRTKKSAGSKSDSARSAASSDLKNIKKSIDSSVPPTGGAGHNLSRPAQFDVLDSATEPDGIRVKMDAIEAKKSCIGFTAPSDYEA